MSKNFMKYPSSYIKASTAVTIPHPFDKYYQVITAPKLAKMLDMPVRDLPRCGKVEKECKHLAWLIVKDEYADTRLADSELNFVELIHETDYDKISIAYTVGRRVYTVSISEIERLL